MKDSVEIVVVGAGLVGLVVATLLADQERLNIVVLDAGTKPDFCSGDECALRVSALAPGSVELLSGVGVWQHIVNERASAFRRMRVWDVAGSVDGPETLSFDAAEFGLPQLGFIVENLLIQHALLRHLQDTGVSIRFETEIVSIDRGARRCEIRLASGATLTPDLLIGADGARSFVRESAGITTKLWRHQQKAFVTHLRPERAHGDTAWQRFLADGPLGLLPLSDGRVSCVWSTTADNADSALAMSVEQLSERMTQLSDNVLGQLVPEGPRGVFPLQSQHAERYAADGLVLIGDAAHAIHPLAGQGVNLGFADAHKLAEVIIAALQANESIGDLPTLRKYERGRFATNQLMLSFVDGLNRLFSNESAALRDLRNTGMMLFNNSGPLRTHAVQVALGLR